MSNDIYITFNLILPCRLDNICDLGYYIDNKYAYKYILPNRTGMLRHKRERQVRFCFVLSALFNVMLNLKLSP